MLANRTQKSGTTYLEYVPTPTEHNEAFTTQTPIQYNEYGT